MFFLFGFSLIGLVGFSQTTTNKDKYGYNSGESRFNTNKSILGSSNSSANQNRSSGTTNNSSSNASRNTSTSSANNSSSNSSYSSSSPGLYERKDPPVNNPPVQTRTLEPGKVWKAKQ